MQKFIITDKGVFKYGNVRMHRDLLAAGESCIGGGFYEFDYISNRLLLSGQSYDFGRPQWSRIDTLFLPGPFRGLTVLYEGERIDKFLKTKFLD